MSGECKRRHKQIMLLSVAVFTHSVTTMRLDLDVTENARGHEAIKFDIKLGRPTLSSRQSVLPS